MIRKSNKNLLNWIYEYIIDFTDEKDVSGLTWTSTHDFEIPTFHPSKRKGSKIRILFKPFHLLPGGFA